MAEQIEIEVGQDPYEEETVEVFIDEDGLTAFGDEFDEDYEISFGENIAEVMDDSALGELASKITSLNMSEKHVEKPSKTCISKSIDW